jgi:hypothetical protein
LKQGILPGFTENECFDLNESPQQIDIYLK